MENIVIRQAYKKWNVRERISKIVQGKGAPHQRRKRENPPPFGERAG
jgi:hypothetical protein